MNMIIEIDVEKNIADTTARDGGDPFVTQHDSTQLKYYRVLGWHCWPS